MGNAIDVLDGVFNAQSMLCVLVVERYRAKILACDPDTLWEMQPRSKFNRMVAMACEVMGRGAKWSADLQRKDRDKCCHVYDYVYNMGTFRVIICALSINRILSFLSREMRCVDFNYLPRRGSGEKILVHTWWCFADLEAQHK